MDGFKNSTSRPPPSVCRFLQQNLPLGDMRAWRELKEATHEVVFMPTRQMSATWR
jgi:hypothetical protein